MVLFLKRPALITLELKNAWTHQTARVHGIRQYQRERDHTQPLLQFGRCVVHMAVDTEEAWMCTRLNGLNSIFLPFNKGFKEGAGNPPAAEGFGHRTNYLWDEVLTQGEPRGHPATLRPLGWQAQFATRETHLVLPALPPVASGAQDLDARQYERRRADLLIQHSAGSGKSNSITWAAYQLIECYPDNAGVHGSKGVDTPLFDSVIVVTDRRLLDKQIRRNIKQFSEVKNIVAPALSSADLKAAMESGKKIDHHHHPEVPLHRGGHC